MYARIIAEHFYFSFIHVPMSVCELLCIVYMHVQVLHVLYANVVMIIQQTAFVVVVVVDEHGNPPLLRAFITCTTSSSSS